MVHLGVDICVKAMRICGANPR